ncbi:hypothetical protein AMATHDRAFT_74119 [Amanita thiersii Skay4041]|uniref:Kinesin motor domain-containing protein n=1 Tax=Amanita thiersii Skay4041 TaxID=703135 RepID=A0A2A9NNU1_9AGAR|nr:hypothetical protein AMATHDRAFT_74119 [Amanita thiersii Skay4041]
MVAAGSITVAVRVRPPTAWEAARLPEVHYDTTIRGDGTFSTPKVVNTAPLRDVIQIVDDRILTFDPDEKDRTRAFMERGFMPPGTKRYKDKRFMFDRVLRHDARQQDVYEATAQPLLQGVLDGYNATVFAYGATGCGKTHTISGAESDPGIIYLTMADLFQRIEDRREEWDVEVMVTFLEIYNEEIRDLLAEPGSHAPRGGLSIREDKAVKVVGLVELKPRSADEVKEIVIQGNMRRTQSPTHANETSSRSHAVLQVHITQCPRTASLTEQRLTATLSIIDLAGSERAAATTNMGQRMVEGANINKSLLALGNCINALCESGGAIRHVPYRNSKLTRLLKFSLGGNCKTVMIVCVAPTSNHFDDTHNTLVYAERATRIRTKVVTRNVLNVDRHVGQYVEAINRLNLEVAELKAKLAGKRDSENEVVRRKKVEAAAEVERSNNDMKQKFEFTKISIADGASCSAKISVAKAKLSAIRARLSEIDSCAQPLSADLEAERVLLLAFGQPEERVIRPDSSLSSQLQRSSNSSAMFDATMRAVSERRSEKLDEVSLENIRLAAMRHRAEMETVKANKECDVLRDAMKDISRIVVGLIGMLGRCTLAVGEAASTLDRSPGQGGENVLEDQSQAVAALLKSVKEGNDVIFQRLLGQSTAGYTLGNLTNASTSIMDAYKNYDTLTRRVGPGPAALQTGTSITRRSSISAVGSPSRRGLHRSPRKSLRSSLAAQPYRRVVSDKEKKVKSVQWKDQAGGSLDDGGLHSDSQIKQQPVVSAISASPAAGDKGTSTINASSRSGPLISTSLPPRSSSSLSFTAGSESEWEDENEKTDDSFGSLVKNEGHDVSFKITVAAPISAPLSSKAAGKRPRPSRLDPSFLKSRSKMSTLSSLQETEECASPTRPSRRQQQQHPLDDMSISRVSTSSEGSVLGNLNIPKHRNEEDGSPTRRGPSIPNRPSSSASTSSSTSTVTGNPQGKSVVLTARRRSNIGPMRIEKARRRSSMIPQLSPNNMGSGEQSHATRGPTARRVMIASPTKRTKRMSLTRTAGAIIGGGSTRAGRLSGLSVPSLDPNANLPESRPNSRAAWR